MEGLLNALCRVIDATNEHDNAKAKYDGWSWGYAGAGLIYERDAARKDFVERLSAVIDERVDARIQAMTVRHNRLID